MPTRTGTTVLAVDIWIWLTQSWVLVIGMILFRQRVFAFFQLSSDVQRWEWNKYWICGPAWFGLLKQLERHNVLCSFRNTFVGSSTLTMYFKICFEFVLNPLKFNASFIGIVSGSKIIFIVLVSNCINYFIPSCNFVSSFLHCIRLYSIHSLIFTVYAVHKSCLFWLCACWTLSLVPLPLLIKLYVLFSPFEAYACAQPVLI